MYTSTKQTVVAAVGFGHFTVASLVEINENVKKTPAQNAAKTS